MECDSKRESITAATKLFSTRWPHRALCKARACLRRLRDGPDQYFQ